MRLRIGSVPYLNAKPLVDWFHSPDCDADVEVIYAVPSKLAEMLRNGELDVCNCSIFEGLSRTGLCVVPDVSISSNGPVKSVRLFCKRPIHALQTVALDTSSLTSAALTRIILNEQFHTFPEYYSAPPQLEEMLQHYDAGLIIGDLKLFKLHDGTEVFDLGECWQTLTGLPFVYAAWQTPVEVAAIMPEMSEILLEARNWGIERLDELASRWSLQMGLPYYQCIDYFTNAMDYNLTPVQIRGLQAFHTKCCSNGLITNEIPLRVIGS